MSGLDLLGELRSRAAGTPVAVMTAFASVDYAVEALRRDADEFLVKPVAAATLLERITALAVEGRAKRAAEGATETVLAVGAHPDDVEIGVGATLASHRAAVTPSSSSRCPAGRSGARSSSAGTRRSPPPGSSGRACTCTTSRTRGSTPRAASITTIEELIREVEPDRGLHAQRARPAPGPSRGPAGRRRRRPPRPVARVLPEPVVDHRLPAHPLRPRRRVHRGQAADARGVRVAVAPRLHGAGPRARHRPLLVAVRRRRSTRSRWRWCARPRCSAPRRGPPASSRSPRRTSSTSTEVTHEGPGHGCRGPRGGRGHPVAAAPRRRRGDRRRHGPLGQRPVPGGRRVAAPGARRRGPRASSTSVRGICRDERVDVLFPTVDVELPKLAAARDELLADGTILASPALHTLETCLDKLALAARVRTHRARAADRAAGHAAGGLRLGLPGHRQAPPRRRLARRPAGRHAGRARRRARRRRGPAGPGAPARATSTRSTSWPGSTAG